MSWPYNSPGNDIVDALDAAGKIAERLHVRARDVNRIARTCACGAHRATALTTDDERDFRRLREHLRDARRTADEIDEDDDGKDET